MYVKYFEIRDRGTFIPVLAHKPAELLAAGWRALGVSNPIKAAIIKHGLGRSGFCEDCDSIILTKLNSTVESRSDPMEWGRQTRTMRVAHEYIFNNWEGLDTGEVVDVEFILNETSTPKRSEALP